MKFAGLPAQGVSDPKQQVPVPGQCSLQVLDYSSVVQLDTFRCPQRRGLGFKSVSVKLNNHVFKPFKNQSQNRNLCMHFLVFSLLLQCSKKNRFRDPGPTQAPNRSKDDPMAATYQKKQPQNLKKFEEVIPRTDFSIKKRPARPTRPTEPSRPTKPTRPTRPTKPTRHMLHNMLNSEFPLTYSRRGGMREAIE